MKHCSTVKDVEHYPFPEFRPMVEEISTSVKDILERYLLACSSYEMGTFEQGHALMGMEELLNMMYVDPEMWRKFLIPQLKKIIEEYGYYN